jgi:2OG-Fe(II) oxygenase superfamily
MIGNERQHEAPVDDAVKDGQLSSDGPPFGIRPAWRTIPPIPGLHYDLDRLRIPVELGAALLDSIEEHGYFCNGSNQVMLFGRASSRSGGLPFFINNLIEELGRILRPHIPLSTHHLLFPSVSDQSRQAILNRYEPGEGITPHVDLLKRFGDGIIGVSLGAGCVMDFKEVEGDTEWSIWLPPLSVIVLEGDARYRWTHGIEHVRKDWVSKEGSEDKSEWIERGLRMSITLRWLLPRADIVGETDVD